MPSISAPGGCLESGSKQETKGLLRGVSSPRVQGIVPLTRKEEMEVPETGRRQDKRGTRNSRTDPGTGGTGGQRGGRTAGLTDYPGPTGGDTILVRTFLFVSSRTRLSLLVLVRILDPGCFHLQEDPFVSNPGPPLLVLRGLMERPGYSFP